MSSEAADDCVELKQWCIQQKLGDEVYHKLVEQDFKYPGDLAQLEPDELNEMMKECGFSWGVKGRLRTAVQSLADSEIQSVTGSEPAIRTKIEKSAKKHTVVTTIDPASVALLSSDAKSESGIDENPIEYRELYEWCKDIDEASAHHMYDSLVTNQGLTSLDTLKFYGEDDVNDMLQELDVSPEVKDKVRSAVNSIIMDEEKSEPDTEIPLRVSLEKPRYSYSSEGRDYSDNESTMTSCIRDTKKYKELSRWCRKIVDDEKHADEIYEYLTKEKNVTHPSDFFKVRNKELQSMMETMKLSRRIEKKMREEVTSIQASPSISYANEIKRMCGATAAVWPKIMRQCGTEMIFTCMISGDFKSWNECEIVVTDLEAVSNRIWELGVETFFGNGLRSFRTRPRTFIKAGRIDYVFPSSEEPVSTSQMKSYYDHGKVQSFRTKPARIASKYFRPMSSVDQPKQSQRLHMLIQHLLNCPLLVRCEWFMQVLFMHSEKKLDDDTRAEIRREAEEICDDFNRFCHERFVYKDPNDMFGAFSALMSTDEPEEKREVILDPKAVPFTGVFIIAYPLESVRALKHWSLIFVSDPINVDGHPEFMNMLRIGYFDNNEMVEVFVKRITSKGLEKVIDGEIEAAKRSYGEGCILWSHKVSLRSADFMHQCNILYYCDLRDSDQLFDPESDLRAHPYWKNRRDEPVRRKSLSFLKKKETVDADSDMCITVDSDFFSKEQNRYLNFRRYGVTYAGILNLAVKWQEKGDYSAATRNCQHWCIYALKHIVANPKVLVFPERDSAKAQKTVPFMGVFRAFVSSADN